MVSDTCRFGDFSRISVIGFDVNQMGLKGGASYGEIIKSRKLKFVYRSLCFQTIIFEIVKKRKYLTLKQKVEIINDFTYH